MEKRMYTLCWFGRLTNEEFIFYLRRSQSCIYIYVILVSIILINFNAVEMYMCLLSEEQICWNITTHTYTRISNNDGRNNISKCGNNNNNNDLNETNKLLLHVDYVVTLNRLIYDIRTYECSMNVIDAKWPSVSVDWSQCN